jgi:hypothetical protein
MFVVVTALCVWLAFIVNRANRQKEAVVAIEDLNGWVARDFVLDSTKPWYSLRSSPSPWPNWLPNWIGRDIFGSVGAVGLEGSEASDREIQLIVECLPSLQYLDLRQTRVGVSTIASLSKLTRLQVLYLACTQIDDEALVHLGRIKGLCVLDLGHTKVTDVGIMHLKHLGRLKKLCVEGTAVTEDGFHRLQKANRHPERYRY